MRIVLALAVVLLAAPADVRTWQAQASPTLDWPVAGHVVTRAEIELQLSVFRPKER